MTTLVANVPPVKVWVPIPGYEGLYEVSNQGDVRSIDRLVKYPNGKPNRLFKGKLLKQSLQVKKRYYGLRLSKQGKTRLWLTHQLVAMSFLGPQPKGMMVCHGSLGPFCNTVENLSYGTAVKNSLDQWRDGTKPHGEKCSWSKLTAAQVKTIKEEYAAGIRNKDLAIKYNVSPSRICDIIKGRGWNYLDNDYSCCKCTSNKSVGQSGISV